MKLLKTLLNKKIENQEIFHKHGFKQYYYEEQISIFLMSLFYLISINPKYAIKTSKRNKLWKKYMSCQKSLRSKYYKKILNNKKQEDDCMIKAFDFIEKEKESKSQEGSLWQPYTYGVLAYEFEANE